MNKFVFLFLMAAFSLSASQHNTLSASDYNPLSASKYNYVDIAKTGRGDNLIIITGVGGNIFWDNAIK